MSNVIAFNPCALLGTPVQTPLAHRVRSASSPEVTLAEAELTGLLVLRGDATDADFQAAVAEVFGAPLPKRLSTTESTQARLLWLGPDEFWIWCEVTALFTLEQSFRARFAGHCALVNNTGGFTRITVQGAAAQTVLMKSVPYPVYADVFPVGKVVATVFAKTQAVICRRGEQHWEVVARRSFADYIWRWLVDAMSTR